METTLPISEVRRTLFQLFDKVTEGEADAVILIERQGREERAVLVSEEYLGKLERKIMIRENQLREYAPDLPGNPFKLIGSMASEDDVEWDFLAWRRENNAEQARLREAKEEYYRRMEAELDARSESGEGD